MASPESLFLVLASILGIAYVAATPPLHAPDELRHLRRATQIASGGIADGAMIPASLDRLASAVREGSASERRGSRGRAFPLRNLHAAASIPLDREVTRYAAGDRYLPYGPIAYAPAILAVWLGSKADVRPLALLYLARLSLLAGAIVVLYLAVRVSPTLPWTLCLVALLPTVTYVRSGVSADTLTTAFAFLLFALVMRVRGNARPVGNGDVLALTSAATALGLCKIGYLPLALVVLALPPAHFASPRRRWLCVCAVLGVSGVVSWLWLAGLGDFVATDVHRRADVDVQRRLLLDDPVRFLSVLEATWLAPGRLASVASSFVGRVLVLSVPGPIVLVCLAGIASVLLVDRRTPGPKLVERLAFLGVAVICLLGICLGLYLKTTAPGSATIRGFQGRYLYPVASFALFALLPPRPQGLATAGAAPAVIVVLVALLANAWGLASIVTATWLGAS